MIRSVAVVSVLVVGCLAAGGCSSGTSNPGATTSAATSPLSGSYTTHADAFGATTTYTFNDDGTYAVGRIPCDATTGACSDHGRYSVGAAAGSVIFVSAVTGATTSSPLTITDVQGSADAGAGATTPQDLVTRDGGAVVVTEATDLTAQSFVLGSAGSALLTHESPVLDQLNTSNCWIYTAMGWAAALANHATPGTSHQYSPAYIYYWHQYEEMTGGGLVTVSGHPEISWGGFWSTALAIALRYGMMNNGQFVADDAAASQTAFDAINTSMKSGSLAVAGALSDHALVRKELDKAWGLSSATSAALDATFGTDASRDFTGGATEPSDGSIFVPKDIAAELTNGTLSAGTLAPAIGTPGDEDDNTGTLDWSATAWPGVDLPYASYQPLFTKIIKVLNDGFPVPIVWYADSDSETAADGSFQVPASTSLKADGGWHYSLIADYQVSDAPGFGTLRAGSARSDAQKAAAADPAAQVVFFRIKNSWGNQGNAGYNDLYLAYIAGTVRVCASTNKCEDDGAVGHVVLPPGY